MPLIRPVDPANPDPTPIAKAAECLAGGGVVVFPTHCLYGLAVDALNPQAVDKIFQIKKRSQRKPILILIPTIEALEKFIKPPGPTSRKLMNHFWPGQVTAIFRCLPNIPANLSAGTGKIGVRLPSHPVASGLVKRFNGPITGTSANLSGQVGCSAITDLDASLVDQVDMILDAGILKGGIGSTVVDAEEDPLKVLREGTVSTAEIANVIR